MSTLWYPAYIGLGSNINGPVKQLKKALKALQNSAGIQIQSISSFYQTEPYGGVEQDDFVNAVASILTTLSAEKLLHTLLDIETDQGRERTQHWGPRVLDLDLLVYSDQTSDNDFLTLPHPEISKRNFVLVPFAEIADTVMVPSQGRVSALLQKVPSAKIVKLESN